MLIGNVMQVSLDHKGQVVDRAAPKTEGAATLIFETNLGRKGGAVYYSYSKAKCRMVRIE